MMGYRTLTQVAAEHPYPDFADWWPMGQHFLTFMAEAIGSQWLAICGNPAPLDAVQQDVTQYIDIVYHRNARPTLAADFFGKKDLASLQSGEFDALSYAFYKSAFMHLANAESDQTLVRQARHTFTQKVGRLFYTQLHNHLSLALPAQLTSQNEFQQLQKAIALVGMFLQQQGYLRDHFAFGFDVNVMRGGEQIVQHHDDIIGALTNGQSAYALYEMGYPAILPSAVYLYQTMGEAQHHSSRTIEELFGRIGYCASETADFDPTGYPSDLVVELWEIRR